MSKKFGLSRFALCWFPLYFCRAVLPKIIPDGVCPKAPKRDLVKVGYPVTLYTPRTELCLRSPAASVSGSMMHIRGAEVNLLTGHTYAVSCVAFSPDGSILASGSWDETIRLWDGRTGESLRTLFDDVGEVRSLTFSPDGSTLASGGHDAKIRLWNVHTGKRILTLEGHTRYVSAVAFSHAEPILASGSSDGTIRLWDTRTGEELRTLPGHSEAVL